MKKHPIVRGVVSVAATLASLSGGLLALSSTPASAAVTKTTVTIAESPSTPPNYIFPFMSLAYFSVVNINQFQELMFRPLYYFGKGKTPNLTPARSLAKTPVYSNGNKTVTITLKTYKWSDGEKVTATDFKFWMNMMHADKATWAGYVPGGLSIPDDITAISIKSPTSIQMTLNNAYNPDWYTYNELSQITPLPLAWTKTSTSAAAGSGGCAKAAWGAGDKACTAVYKYLSKEAGYNPTTPQATNNALPTYATNPLWQVVDGPWKLSKFNATGTDVMVANPTYSGPVKPTIKTVEFKPFTTDTAEFNALVSGSIDDGYLPIQDLTKGTSTPLKLGPNNPRLAKKFNMAIAYPWSINYFPLNFNSSGDTGNAGPIFKQFYFRQALQYLVNQPLYISRLAKGYGVGTYGPVPVEPPNSFASSYEKKNPYTYNPTKAKALLKSHGWSVKPNGVDTCVKPGTGMGECGATIKKGAKLTFTMPYASGVTVLTDTINAEKASWASAGIKIAVTPESFNSVIGSATPCPTTTCSWEMANWGGGWLFAPDYYPTGEDIFAKGAGSNSGSYETATSTALIQKTDFTNTKLTKYENYLAKNLPVVWQPNTLGGVGEVIKGLKVPAASPLENITPVTWRW